ncbi:MAG: polyphosphate kinase 1, partial [Bacteroidales bacterium]
MIQIKPCDIMDTIGNRELSWLQFNDRVMQEAQDVNVPLMQRLRFLGIYSNNQDEFIKVRIANLIRYAAIRNNTMTMTGDYTAAELLPLVNQRMRRSQDVFRDTYRHIIKEMEDEGVYMVDHNCLSDEQLEFCREYFLSVISVRLVTI